MGLRRQCVRSTWLRIISLSIGSLVAACDDDAGGSTETDAMTGPSTRDDGSVAARADAGTDARTSTRDADASRPGSNDDERDARVEERDAGPAADRDAEVGDPGDASTAVPDAGSGGRKPVFVAVGYSGARYVSRDLGLTWTLSTPLVGKGDDANLLRSVTYANGMFVAVGSKIWTTTDGTTWTERKNPANQWFGGIEYGVPKGLSSGIFVAAGGVGTSVYSSNGIDWTANAGDTRKGEHARTLAFGDGQFICGTDAKKWWVTTNGKDWKEHSGNHGGSQLMWCSDKFTEVSACTTPLAHANARTALGEGVYVSAAGNKLERSTDGKVWTSVKDVKDSPLEDVAFGYLP
jgi:hypothetical protein